MQGRKRRKKLMREKKSITSGLSILWACATDFLQWFISVLPWLLTSSRFYSARPTLSFFFVLSITVCWFFSICEAITFCIFFQKQTQLLWIFTKLKLSTHKAKFMMQGMEIKKRIVLRKSSTWGGFTCLEN